MNLSLRKRPLNVAADADRIFQLGLNLIDKAVKYIGTKEANHIHAAEISADRKFEGDQERV